MLLSNNRTERYLLFFSVLDCWLRCSIPLQVGAIVDANYLLQEWESRKSVLVNPPKFDASASDSVKTKSSFLNRCGQFWCENRTQFCWLRFEFWFESRTRRIWKDWHETIRGPILIQTANNFNRRWKDSILRWLNQLQLYSSLGRAVTAPHSRQGNFPKWPVHDSDWLLNLMKWFVWENLRKSVHVCSFPASNWRLFKLSPLNISSCEFSSYFLELSSRRDRGARGRAGWHMCWPGSAGLRGLIVWLRSSLQIIADKITPAIISENEFPHARHLIWCGASITSIHILGPRTICEYLTYPFVILKHSDAVMWSLYASYRR